MIILLFDLMISVFKSSYNAFIYSNIESTVCLWFGESKSKYSKNKQRIDKMLQASLTEGQSYLE